MSGDTTTLSWKLPSPGADGPKSPVFGFAGDGGAVKILKVCFSSSNNLKNFKLVKCDSSWQIRVRVMKCAGNTFCRFFDAYVKCKGILCCFSNVTNLV